jgi:hypothetical protein
MKNADVEKEMKTIAQNIDTLAKAVSMLADRIKALELQLTGEHSPHSLPPQAGYRR